MVRKELDKRIRTLIETGVKQGHRSMFVVVGDKAQDQTVILHNILSKTTIKSRPNVLWCYKKDLGFSSHRQKRMKQMKQKRKQGKVDINEDDPFELFILSTNIRYCYYAETHKILGNTFGMCILQDFEALTPNILARTIETVEGGGLVVLLLRSINSLKQLHTMAMDIHARYRTEAHNDVVGRFNERFILSLASCNRCLVVDDQLNILPVSSHSFEIKTMPAVETVEELKELKASMQDTQPVGSLLNCCCTLDQAKAVLKFVECISEKTLRSTVALTAARGRGKSAALGLSMAAAVAFGYSNIFVTSPSPENLKTLFEFIFKGFDALQYSEHEDYSITQSSNPEFNKAVVRVDIFHDHRQTIQYIHPTDAAKLGQAELVVIDEAAAIPLPLVKALLGPYLVFMASTVNGYEGTGRSLSLKLIEQLRVQSRPMGASTKHKEVDSKLLGRSLAEITLDESIRYRNGDACEAWLNHLLCLDATLAPPMPAGCPSPENCDLYYVDRDALFSYDKASEAFLQRVMSLMVSSHYKNTPNDLQMLSDAPAHHLFCLLGPLASSGGKTHEVFCVIQVCLEGDISSASIMQGLARGQRSSGDLIPWTVGTQFLDQDFPKLSGARVIRIATHTDYQGMGYGSRALELLEKYYERNMINMEETEESEHKGLKIVNEETVGELGKDQGKSRKLRLLLKLSERKPERLDYLGTSFGLTGPLLKFWKKAGYVPVYLRQTANDLTGEHSCIMLKVLRGQLEDTVPVDNQWLQAFWLDFRRRFISLLGFQFRKMSPALALAVLHNKSVSESHTDISRQELEMQLSQYDLKRLEYYSRNMADYHLIMDLLPNVSKIYCVGSMGDTHFSAVQLAILIGLGLQYKTADELATELELPTTQLLGLFNRTMRKMSQYLSSVVEQDVAAALESNSGRNLVSFAQPLAQSLSDELDEDAKKLKEQQMEELKKLQLDDLSQFTIKGSENEWSSVLAKNPKGIVSLKSGEKRRLLDAADDEAKVDEEKPDKKKKHKNQSQRGKKKVKK
ncbi:RNA cytidine acetyltransferase-like [Daphnia pulicaria]|uniref:RNA cytidine acetyltransferase-like n=1 Tax=Daphnia pulicaria TaxID=35523 RepID=UPI001EEC29ED|nr:RNA cytidine acetyltransferase-like [Daphnia pulicaria]